MTNSSPLEVKYKWYFLRQPPVHRQDPEQCDEGVDMQSECETDSLTEEESQEESESLENEGEEEESEREEEEENSEGEVEEGESEGEREVEQVSEKGDVTDLPEDDLGTREEDSRSGSRVSEVERETTVAEKDPPTEEPSTAEVAVPVVAPTTAARENGDSPSGSAAQTKQQREKQPWELVDDPFKLVRIEQVV